MTLTELQNKLGEQIELLTDPKTPHVAKKQLADIAIIVSSLAKQMINNADVVLRTEKLIADGKLKDSAMKKFIYPSGGENSDGNTKENNTGD